MGVAAILDGGAFLGGASCRRGGAAGAPCQGMAWRVGGSRPALRGAPQPWPTSGSVPATPSLWPGGVCPHPTVPAQRRSEERKERSCCTRPPPDVSQLLCGVVERLVMRSQQVKTSRFFGAGSGSFYCCFRALSTRTAAADTLGNAATQTTARRRCLPVCVRCSALLPPPALKPVRFA